MKKILYIILAVIVLLVGWRIFQTIRAKQNGSTQAGFGKSGGAITVELAPVIRTAMQDVGRFGGSLKPRASYTLASRIAGRLERLQVSLGDRVSNGQLLAVMDSAVLKQELDQARASLSVAQAQVEQSRLAMKAEENDWLTVKSLFNQKYESQAAMDRADAEYELAKSKYQIAQAEVERARSALTKAEIQLSYAELRAAWSGGGKTRLVGEIMADEGDLLAANSPILTLVDNSTVTAEIDIIEKDYVRVKPGQAVEVSTDAFPGKVFPGKLTRLAPVLQETSRQARAEIDIPNADGLLKPGMYVRVEVLYESHPNVAAVPLEAVVRRDGKTGVFTADRKTMKVSFVPVTTGIMNEKYAEITEPELKGEVVILGQDQLQDGGQFRLPQNNENNGKSDRKVEKK
jgi:RND family efflux transporter MFP subunit